MHTNPKVNYYKLIDYFDVLGNKEDGWEVNNLCTVREDIAIAEDATDQDIIEILININYLNEFARNGGVYIESSDDTFIEIFDTETDKPLYRLEKIL